MSATNWLTMKDLRERFQVARATIYQWMDDPAIRFPKPALTMPRCVRWRTRDVIAFEQRLARNKRTPRTAANNGESGTVINCVA